MAIRDDLGPLRGEAVLKSLTTGRLGDRTESPVSFDASVAFTQPAVKGALSGKTLLGLDFETNAVRLSDMKLTWKGDAFDVRGDRRDVGRRPGMGRQGAGRHRPLARVRRRAR